MTSFYTLTAECLVIRFLFFALFYEATSNPRYHEFMTQDVTSLMDPFISVLLQILASSVTNKNCQEMGHPLFEDLLGLYTHTQASLSHGPPSEIPSICELPGCYWMMEVFPFSSL